MYKVGVGFTEPYYNNDAPFHPDENFPEYSLGGILKGENGPYRLLRRLFFDLGYDIANYNTTAWNPLGHIINPGQTVVIKPNFVSNQNLSDQDVFAVITHPSILRCLVDYVFIALKGEGRIIITDSPQMDCDWKDLMHVQNLKEIASFYRDATSFEIEYFDLRDFTVVNSSGTAYSSNRQKLSGDPQGEVIVNLGKDSKFYNLPSENYYGADFNRDETIRHHQGEVHEYCVSKTILDADVFISVPKLKVHKKVGVTLNLKGLVGINTNKNYLVHYRVGTPSEGGDQLPDDRPGGDRIIIKVQRFLYDRTLAKQNKLGDFAYRCALWGYRTFVKPFRHVSAETTIQDGGNWHGNDSAWRMTADLARILVFADSHGKLHQTPQRKLFCVIDGIIGGENNGPLSPDPKESGCLVCGEDPLATDIVAARLMGFDPAKIKQFSLADDPAFPDVGVPSESIEVISEREDVVRMFQHKDPLLAFRPHPGWVGHLEVNSR